MSLVSVVTGAGWVAVEASSSCAILRAKEALMSKRTKMALFISTSDTIIN